jgi:hypothetical protein
MLGDEHLTPITEQNIQARLRGSRMWNWANTSRALFLQAGNMSEKSVGYTTVGGDLEGCFSVIANLPKTVVVAMLDRLYRRYAFEGIAAVLATTAGPELASSQSGEAELMPFSVLDACLYLYAGEKRSEDEVAEALGYFLGLTMFKAFEEAFDPLLGVVTEDALRSVDEALALDEELRGEDPAEAVDSDDVVAMEQPHVVMYIHEHLDTALEVHADSADVDAVHAMYRTLLVELLALSYAVRPPVNVVLPSAEFTA